MLSVEGRLALAARPLGVADRHRHLDEAQAQAADLVQDLDACAMRFCVIRSARAASAMNARRPLCVSVMSRPAATARERGRQAQHHAAAFGHPHRAAEEARAERDVGAALGERGHEGRDVLGPVLAVAVEGDDVAGAAGERQVDAGLQGRALAEVDRVAHHRHAGVAAGARRCRRSSRRRPRSRAARRAAVRPAPRGSPAPRCSRARRSSLPRGGRRHRRHCRAARAAKQSPRVQAGRCEPVDAASGLGLPRPRNHLYHGEQRCPILAARSSARWRQSTSATVRPILRRPRASMAIQFVLIGGSLALLFHFFVRAAAAAGARSWR